MDIQPLFGNRERVFEPLPVGIPPDRGFDHAIEIEEGSNTVIIITYMHPNRFKNEIEKVIKEIL